MLFVRAVFLTLVTFTLRCEGAVLWLTGWRVTYVPTRAESGFDVLICVRMPRMRSKDQEMSRAFCAVIISSPSHHLAFGLAGSHPPVLTL